MQYPSEQLVAGTLLSDCGLRLRGSYCPQTLSKGLGAFSSVQVGAAAKRRRRDGGKFDAHFHRPTPSVVYPCVALLLGS